ncbi:hypothetical protein [Saccharopolyspora sp. ASAGF58]|uniref:hypothetical protein n=1 Tax=Saccharopolyspora sp. ASAGF58 TaxID=2719023 RepID=UPI00143FC916|nr:hypothetical protein [Saccharopolyspora sp. ASAGF58]QIZ35948.1 hypothetical protein FDZ84_16170 [Saccharopolyspora sp. ASAGF58]
MAHQAESGELIGGRYRLVLGSGHRWRARDEDSGTDVSLEWTRLPSAQEAAEYATRFDRERTERERRQTAALRACPNLVFVDDVVAADDVLWSATRLVEGRTLAEDVSTYGPLATETVRPVATDLLKALAAAHGAGITHGALSPATVRLAGDGEALLTGFGAPADEQAYRAPERNHEQQALAPGDLFSLGTTLHFALKGAPPSSPGFAAGDAGELGPLIARLRATDPAQRPTAPEALALLEPPAAPVTQVTPPQPSQAPDDPSPFRMAAVVGAVLAIGVLLALIIGVGQQESSTGSSAESSTETTDTTTKSTYTRDKTTDTDEDETSYPEEPTRTADPTEEAFQAVPKGSCLPIYQTGNGNRWNRSVPPDTVPCNSDYAGVFKVISTTLSRDQCYSASSDYVPWSYTGSSGETATLCLDRVWVPRYCILAEKDDSDRMSIGTNTAVDCYATSIPSSYNTILVVSSVEENPSTSCSQSSSDPNTYWSMLADEGSSRVCFTYPT